MTTSRPRRVEYSETTREALVDSAVSLFTEQGYAGTSLDEIVKRARVTKGALYHHFDGKKTLFEAVFEAVDTQVVAKLTEAITAFDDPWETMRSGLHAFLEVCLEPSYQRIVVHEGPVVMGWERWCVAEDQFTFGIVRSVIGQLIDAGEIDALPVEALSRVVFGAMSSGATTIAGAPQPKQASIEVGQCIERMMEGLRVPRSANAGGEP